MTYMFILKCALKLVEEIIHLHSLDSNNVMKKESFIFNFDFYSHIFLIKTWSEQTSRSELVAAHLKLAESVDTVGNTDR